MNKATNWAAGILWVLGLALPFARAENTESIFNADMELGSVGEAAPNFYLRFRLDPAVAFDADGPPLFPVTTPGGVTGNCLTVPARRGLREYNLESQHFDLPSAGDVAISFWAKSDREAAESMTVDFRCYNRAIQYGSVAERYPVLESYTVPLGTNWTFHTKTLPVKAGFPYSIWFRRAVTSLTNDLGALVIDSLSIRPATQAHRGYPDELVAAPDRFVPFYGSDETPRLALRARLNGGGARETVTLRVSDDEDGRLAREIALTLTRQAAATGDDPRAAYTGSVVLAGLNFGSFSSIFRRGDQVVRSRGGDFAVVHPVVRHPRYTPGWSLGFNWEVNPSHPLAPLTAPSAFSEHNGARALLALMTASGAQTARIRAPWRITEPDKEQFQAAYMSSLVDLARESKMDVVFLLGDTFTHAPPTNTPYARLQGGLPAWLYRDHTIRDGVVLPPLDRWEKYVAFCVTQLMDRVDLWEVVNEPANGWTAAEYLPLQQAAYRIIKRHQPHGVVIGNGATGDLGLRPIGWTRALAALGHENSLDAVAFHPYEAGLDSLGGNYFKYRDVIQGLRAALAQPRPLWNTECYYMKSATLPQDASGEGLANLAAGDITRHYLESLLHGVVAALSPYDGQFAKRRATVPSSVVPNSLFAGVNALSWLLRDLTRLERIDVNRLVYSGLFSDAAGRQGLGFVYDLRANGSRMTVDAAAAARLQWFDLFGNAFTPEGPISLRPRPVYCRGDAAVIRAVLAGATFQAEQGVALTAKAVGDRLAFSARNLAGVPMKIEVAPEPTASLLPERLDFVFTQNDSAAALVPAGTNLPAALAWSCQVNGLDAYNGRLEVQRPPLLVPDGRPLPLPRGSTASVRFEGADLVVAVTVKDRILTAAPHATALWEGDALELFLDADPFHRLDLDRVSSGDEPMNVAQYVFAAQPPGDGGARVWAVHHRQRDFRTRATCATLRTEEGYTLEARIPLDEITPLAAVPPAIGLDLEIDQVDGAAERAKETLSGLSGIGYQRRLHYPLFPLPAPAQRQLLSQAAGRLGAAFPVDPACETNGWPIAAELRPLLSWGAEFGCGGSGGYRIQVTPEAARGLATRGAHLYQRLPIQRGLKRTVTVSLLARLDDVRVVSETNPGGYCSGFFSMVHYYDATRKQHLQNEGVGLTTSLVGTQGWKRYQYRSVVPESATEITLSAGIRGQVAGTIFIDEIDLSYDVP